MKSVSSQAVATPIQPVNKMESPEELVSTVSNTINEISLYSWDKFMKQAPKYPWQPEFCVKAKIEVLKFPQHTCCNCLS